MLDIAERMDRIERIVRDLQTDWDAQYDKFHRLNMRLAKRQKALDDAENGSEGGKMAHEDAPGMTIANRAIQNPLAIALLNRGKYR